MRSCDFLGRKQKCFTFHCCPSAWSICACQREDTTIVFSYKDFHNGPKHFISFIHQLFSLKERQNKATKQCAAHEADFKTITDYSQSLQLSLLNSAGGLNNQTTCLYWLVKPQIYLKSVHRQYANIGLECPKSQHVKNSMLTHQASVLFPVDAG